MSKCTKSEHRIDTLQTSRFRCAKLANTAAKSLTTVAETRLMTCNSFQRFYYELTIQKRRIGQIPFPSSSTNVPETIKKVAVISNVPTNRVE